MDFGITKEELERERTPPELSRWVASKFEEVSSNEKGEDSLILKEGILKQLVEEVYPLSIFGYRKFGETNKVLLKPIIGYQNYDAIIIYKNNEVEKREFIEITQSHEGEIDHLRRLFIKEHGYAFYHSPIKKTGTKKTRVDVSNKLEAVRAEEIAKAEINRIKDAINRKISKEYPPDTALLIAFEDDLFFRLVVSNNILDSIINEYCSGLDIRFSYIYLVGLYRLFREYKMS
jgi:hypothetical protein